MSILLVAGFIAGIAVYDKQQKQQWESMTFKEDKPSYSNSKNEKIYDKSTDECSLQKGKNLIVKDSIFAPTSKENLEELVGYISASNKEAYSMMLLEGKLIPLEIGQKYVIAKTGWTYVELKNLSTGQRVVLGMDMIDDFFKNE